MKQYIPILKIRGSSLALVCLVLLSSCAKKPSSALTSSSTSAINSTPTASPSCGTNSVIDYGQKGTVVGVLRGAYSDTKVIPGTNYPAIAYTDAGALSLKFTYYNGSGYVTEAVAGDNGAGFVRLAFKSDGTPFIFWTLGVNVKAAVRSAPVTSAAATWSAAVIDTGTAPRALEVSVNPLDQFAITFITDTAVAGRAKFLYCNTGCTSPANFVTMSPSAYIENTAVTAATVSTGVAWCKSSSSVYYPAAVYSTGAGATVRYAICQNSTLSNCGNSTNWTAVNVATGLTTNTGSKLHLDSSVTGDVAKVIINSSSGIRSFDMGATLCTAAPAALTARATISAASVNFGSQWMKLLKDVSGKFHVVANNTTSSVAYYNSTTTNVTTWNTIGTVETVTMAATTSGGADVDSSNGIYTSYGLSAVPADLRLARINNITVASNLAVFTPSTPDQTGDIQVTGTQLKNIAVASTSGGTPGVAYVDYSIGAVAGSKLKFALRTGSSSNSQWVSYLIPDTQSPEFPGLAFDENNRPWISYFDAAVNRFFLVTNSAYDGSGTWRTYSFPSIPSGAPVAAPAANNTAVAMYYNGGVANPVMFAIDTNATSKGVRAALFNKSSHAFSAAVSISTLAAGALGAAHIHADFNTSGTIIVGYQDLNLTRTVYSYSTDAVTWSTPLSVSGVAQGQGVSVRINPVTSSPAMAYFEKAANTLYYAPCIGTVASCAVSGWSPVAVDSGCGISGLAVTNEQLLNVGLTFTAGGVANIIYPRGQGAGGNLALATNYTGSFTTSIISQGANGGLAGSNALNFGVAGWSAFSTTNATSLPTTVYLGPGNWLYSNSCND